MSPPRQRLDLIVEVKERAEDAATDAWRAAAQVTRTREAELKALKDAAAKDARRAGDAFHWELEDRAHERLLEEIRQAELRLQLAVRDEAAAREKMAEAHKAAEAVRRVAEARREEARLEEDRAERKALDEVAMQQAARKRLDS